MLWIVLGIIVLLVIFLIATYNRLVKLRNRIEAAWAQIDVQLKRRHDLIPNLVETVKGYAAHERQTLEAVIQARQQAVAATGIENQAQAENILTGALRQLFAVSEAYPDLKANQNFLALQEELTGTEGRIAFSRQFYNEQVLAYDNALETFPTNTIAGMFNFAPKPYFEAEEETRKNVTVDFGNTAPPAVGGTATPGTGAPTPTPTPTPSPTAGGTPTTPGSGGSTPPTTS
ncbi:MAG: LemA protein [Actinomycetota bacterium]|nr:LemA protein [Actinomycetota bacterium]